MKKITLMCIIILLTLGVHAQKKQKPTERATVTKNYTSQSTSTNSVADVEALKNAGSRYTATATVNAQFQQQTTGNFYNPLVTQFVNTQNIQDNGAPIDWPVNIPASTRISNNAPGGGYLLAPPAIPEILYYTFDEVGTTVTNNATSPPAGTASATFNGTQSQGLPSICDAGALQGDGGTSSTNFLATGWDTNLGTSSWSITLKTDLLDGTSFFYIFGDNTANSFRCFAGGAAGAGNMMLRGGGLSDVIATGAASTMEATTVFVYDNSVPEVRAYVDGVLVNAIAQPALNISGTAFKVGGYATSGAFLTGGVLDNFGFYNRALTPAEVLDLNACGGIAPPAGDITECGNSPEFIPATGTSGIMNPSVATVTGTGLVGTDYSIDNVTINLDHTFPDDMEIILVSPTGTRLALCTDNGGSLDIVGDDLIFTDASVNNITAWNNAAPLADYRAEGGGNTFPVAFGDGPGADLNTIFNGEPINGNWTLEINDDAGGDSGVLNSYCITFLDLAVPDPNAPIINCPGDITLDASLGECSAPFGFATPTALDPNGGTVTVTQTMGPASPGPFPVGDTVVEFTATNDDAPNEVTTCQFTVTVVDNQPPMITCPDDITQTNDLGICGAVVIYDDPVIMDNCPTGGGTMGEVILPTQSGVFTSNARGYFFTSPVDMTITGLEVPDTASSAPQAIQVMRFATPPPPFATSGPYEALLFYQNNIVGTGYLPVSIDVTAGDIIGILGVRGADVNSYTTQPDIMIDGNTVTIERLLTQNPISTVEAPQGSFSTEGSANKSRINFSYIAGGGPGGGMLDQTAGLPSGSVFPVGTTTNTFVFTDQGGNTAECSFDITVTDDEAPEVVCVGGAMPATGTATATPGLAIPDGDPAGVTTTLDITDDFDITDLDVDLDISHTWVGDITVSLTAPDGVTTAVIFDRPGYTGTGFGCDGTDVLATLDDEAATPVEDECGAGVPSIAGSFIPNEALSIFDGMSTLGTWTLFISDAATPDPGVLNSWGLTYSYSTNTSPPLEVFLDEEGMVLVPSGDFLSSVSDNCGIASIEVVGGVTVPSIDQCGDNVGGAISSTLPPTLSVTTVAESGLIGPDYTLDNVEINITHTFDGDLDIELVSPAGTALFLSDGNGGSGDNYTNTIFMDGGADINGGSAPFTGTFEPEGGTFAATFDGEDVNGDWTLRVTDNFGGDDGTLDSFCISFVPVNPSAALFTCDDVGNNTTVDILVTDLSGNTAMCTASVTVIDNIDPILVCQNFTLELGPDGTAMLDPMDLIDMANSFDACGISISAVSMDDFTCDDIGTPQVITLFVSDPSGNLASCEATVTVVDALGPEVICPADMTIDPGTNNQLYEVPDYFAEGLASATDNCTDPVTVFAQDPAAGSFIGDGVYTVTLSAFDEYGNEGTCTFELTIESILGTNENTLDAGLTLYPNPAQNQVILSNISNILLNKATMYDVNGKLVQTIDLTDMTTEKTIDISQLSSGVYIVQIEGENASVVKRLIKE